jgi:hypothetical protein
MSAVRAIFFHVPRTISASGQAFAFGGGAAAFGEET